MAFEGHNAADPLVELASRMVSDDLALHNNHLGSSAPSSPVPFQFWVDSANNKLMIRSADDDAWRFTGIRPGYGNSIAQVQPRIPVYAQGFLTIGFYYQLGFEPRGVILAPTVYQDKADTIQETVAIAFALPDAPNVSQTKNLTVNQSDVIAGDFSGHPSGPQLTCRFLPDGFRVTLPGGSTLDDRIVDPGPWVAWGWR